MISSLPVIPLSFSPTDQSSALIGSGQHSELDAATLSRSVLIVEDEAMIAWTLEGLLSDMGFKEIFIVASGSDAVKQAKLKKPGLILSDINLGSGEMDGVTAVAMIADSDVAVVFITAYASPDSRQQISRDLPGAVLLRKPVDTTTLRRAIMKVATGKPN